MTMPAALAAGGDAPWVGSKGGAGVAQRIVAEMPPHGRYIEAFAGRGIVARLKRPAASTIIIDADDTAPAFAAMQDCADVSCVVGSAFDVLPALGLGPSDLVYADPPYLASVRSCPRRYYRHELMTDAEHAALLAMLQALPCMVILSGYWSELYARTLAGWRTVQIPTVNRAGKRAVEWLWLNFKATDQRHDSRFAGDNFRERERIKRKAKRWASRILAMPPAERAAVLAALDERPRTP